MISASSSRAELVRVFRTRLLSVMSRSGGGQSDFARAIGIDRSTLSQILSPTNDRLPRIESVAAIARIGQVSVDWLLGLREIEDREAGVLSDDRPRIEANALSPVDERLIEWHEEATGYKVRHIPSNFPDVLKTEEVIAFEYEHFIALSPQRRIEITRSRLDYLRRPETDMEVCASIQVIESFARGTGIWEDLPLATRRAQLEHLIALCDELYPRYRWYLYDGRRLYSAPITIFGPIRATIYVGQMYLVFQSREHVRALVQHFDQTVRAAVIQPNDLPRYFRDLLKTLG
ncbi:MULTISPECIES: helix-turn-helix domain-containing protein [unclassified Acidisoma]|jgi:transcriptional regulator with XRE-family HTH domain|uniref:helix-turn-helix domain-containing protein n=1 Tax=unclassified Acidisoma TaxID=2634065 RepID=UPI00131D36F8|nr:MULTISPECIES: helix-turn-helix transcriptional regulator [unclassified Acidisoma]